MKKKKISFCFFIIFIITLFQQRVYALNSNNLEGLYLKKYFNAKEKGNFNQAVEYIYQKLLIKKNSDNIIADIFRLNEVIQYSEQTEKGINIINKLNLKHSSNVYIKNVLNNFKLNYLLISGKFKEADSLKKNSGFINSFKFLGPFPFKGEKFFNSFKLEKRRLSNTKYYKGKYFPIKWEKIKSNRKGLISISDLYSNKDSFYIFNTKIKIKKSGEYNFLIGKTGSFKLILNNKNIFINNLKHKIFPGQYIIKLFLHKGIHSIQIYSGENLRSKNTFSLQIYNKKNIPYKANKSSVYNHSKKPQIKIININFVPQILYYNNSNSKFDLGYNIFSYGLNSGKNLAVNIFSSIKKKNIFYSEALYYAGLAELSLERKEHFWKNCLKENPDNIECMEKLAKLKINNKKFSQADNYISLIKRKAPFSIINHRINIYQYIRLGWETEALKKIHILDSNYFKSAAILAKLQLYNYNNDINQLIKNQKKLLTINYYNYSNVIKLVRNIKYQLIPEKQLKLIENFIYIFPEKIELQINAAEILFNLKKYKKAIAALTAAEYLAPNNTEILFLMGKTYNFLKKKKLAEYYIKKAALSAPENRYINNYYNTFFGKKNILEKNSLKINITKLSKLADKYNNEPAVLLLHEKIINVSNDNSYYKKTKLIYKIFNPVNANNLKYHQILLDTDTENLINLKCSLVYNNKETEIGHIITKKISNNRLYSNLYSKIISLPKLTKNSILKIEYLIYSKQGQILKGYFGEKIFYNDYYRILRTSTTLIHPESKKIYAKTYNIKKSNIRKSKSKLLNIYNLQLKNIPPKKRENNMIPFFNRVPSIAFSSFENWTKFFEWYNTLLNSQMILDNKIKKKIKKLIKDAKNDIEKVRLIYSYITNRIRYVGFEIGIKKLQPRKADMTFHSRLGDCKDIAVLLSAIFKEIGFKSKFVLLRTTSNGWIDINFPYAGNFNHAICYIDINGGLYLDGTVKNADIYDLHDEDKDQNVFIIGEKDYSFQYVNDIKYNERTDVVNTNVLIKENGSAVLSRKLIKKGPSAIIARQEFKNIKDKNKSLTLYWNEKFPGAKILNLKLDENILKKPLIYSYDVNISNFIDINKNEIYLPIALYTTNYFKHFTLLKERRNKFYIYNSQLIKQQTIYKIPSNYKIIKFPKNKTLSFKKNFFKFQFKQEKNSLIVKTEIYFNKGIIPPVEYNLFRQFLKNHAKKEIEYILLKRL